MLEAVTLQVYIHTVDFKYSVLVIYCDIHFLQSSVNFVVTVKSVGILL